jgi:hypothetical protein
MTASRRLLGGQPPGDADRTDMWEVCGQRPRDRTFRGKLVDNLVVIRVPRAVVFVLPEGATNI